MNQLQVIPAGIPAVKVSNGYSTEKGDILFGYHLSVCRLTKCAVSAHLYFLFRCCSTFQHWHADVQHTVFIFGGNVFCIVI